MMRHRILVVALIAVADRPIQLIADNITYRVDPAKSRATVHVGKSGMFSFVAGHEHEVGGPIQSGSVDVDLDVPARSRIQLVIAASDLKVSAAREPAGDAPTVQEAMDSDKVLDVAHYSTITYRSTSVTL